MEGNLPEEQRMPEVPLQADGLVRHPPPNPTESLFGYVLRLAEENGYRSPYSVLVLMGVGKHQLRNLRLPLRELARIAHRELCDLERIAYQYSDPPHYRILDHPVGLPDLKRLGRVSLCPECVQSAGFVEAHWDLELMIGCPVHRCRLLSRCPKCHLGLRRMRPGQLECNCGAMFTRVESILPDDEAELLEIIRCKVLGLPVPRESSTGIPVSQLSALSLRGLLSLFRTLARFHLQLKSVKQIDDPQNVVSAAAFALRSFPANFHKLLWTIGEQHVPKQCGGGVRTQFRHVYSSLFNYTSGDSRGTRDFLASALLDFAQNQWGRGFVDGNLLKRIQRTMPKRFVTRVEFGRLFGLGKRTTRRVLALKNIATKTIPGPQKNHVIIDLQQLHEPPTVPGKIFDQPTAAIAIGITVKALRILRASGNFEVKYVVKRDGYHELDIKQFTERLLALNPNPMNATLPSDCITVYRAMCGFHGTGEGGASIIRALLSGKLRPLGNVDGTVRGLFVSRAEFQQFGREVRARRNGSARTLSEAEPFH
jgi:hypothetical protein